MPKTIDHESSESDLAQINRQIFEIKKKIQLSEGQRKAYYEECDAEKKKNIEKIRSLKKTIKQLHIQLGKPPKCDEALLKKSTRDPKDVIALRNKRSEEAIQHLDYKVIDKQKKLDLIRHQTKLQQKKMKHLADEYQDLLINTTSENIKKKLDPESRRISTLENQIHRIDMNTMETNHMRKKYKTIRTSLLADSVMFESTLIKLEESILKQEAEIKHLKQINKEALGLRDSTRGTLLRQEVMVLNSDKFRGRQLQELRYRVEERKAELERLERRIFPSGRSVHQESMSSTDFSQPGVDETTQTIETLEKAFAKLKDATGVKTVPEVLQRFLSQIETKTRLTYLKDSTEEEKKQLEVRKDMMLAELEAFKFAQVKDKEQNEEEVEKLKLGIDAAIVRKQKTELETSNINKQLLQIKSTMHSMCIDLKDMVEEIPPLTDDIENTEDITKILEKGIERLLQFVNEHQELKIPIEQLSIEEKSKKPIDEENWIFPQIPETHPDKTSEPEDEDEVPTRGFLKRQAQVIVDAKSRRKGFSRVAVPRVFGKLK